MKPLGHRAIIRLTQEKGKFILPEKQTEGEIVTINYPYGGLVEAGQGGDRLKTGDKIAFKEYTTTKVGDLYVIDIDDILAIID